MLDDWCQTGVGEPVVDNQVLKERLNVPLETVKPCNLTDVEVNYLLALFDAIDQDRDALSLDERHHVTKNRKYTTNVIFGSVSAQRLQQVNKVDTNYGPHYRQGQTNYCGYCCVANSLADISRESTSVKEMDTLADKLWLQMVDNPSIGLRAELEHMRDQEGFYSVEVMKATLEEHGFQLKKMDGRALLGLGPSDIGRHIISNLQGLFGMVSLIIRKRYYQHWINMTVQGSTPIMKDSQMPLPIPMTLAQLGDTIRKNQETPGAVFFLSNSAPVALKDVHWSQ